MSAKRFRIACILIVIVSQTTAAMAQSGDRDGWQTDFYQPVPPLPPELCFMYHHASTALEGALRGQAQSIHARGSYWLSIAQAMICREQARSLALGNQRRWIEYRITRRQWRELDRQLRITIQRKANDSRRPARTAVFRLEDSELNRFTGVIAWPIVLQAAEYNNESGRLSEIFRERAGYGELSPESSQQIARYTRTFSEKLLRNRSGMSRNDYLAAQKFLCGLKYEAESPTNGGPGLITGPRLTQIN
jgi:hypothetical protein